MSYDNIRKEIIGSQKSANLEKLLAQVQELKHDYSSMRVRACSDITKIHDECYFPFFLNDIISKYADKQADNIEDYYNSLMEFIDEYEIIKNEQKD